MQAQTSVLFERKASATCKWKPDHMYIGGYECILCTPKQMTLCRLRLFIRNIPMKRNETGQYNFHKHK